MSKAMTLLLLITLLSTAPLYAESPSEFISRGNEAAQAKNYKEALSQYQKALNEDPDNSKALLLAALTHANLGNLDDALKLTQKAVKLDPSYVSYYNLGLIQAARKDANEAMTAFGKAISNNADSYIAHYQIGLVYSSLERHTEAIASFTKAIELHPLFHDARIGLAGSYLKLGDRAAALQQIEHLRANKQNDLADALQNRIRA